MSRPILLAAGPLILESASTPADLISGAGFLAAAAAAPYATVQFWARGGRSFTPTLQSVLTARHLDLAGVDFTGVTPRRGPGADGQGPYLPEMEPTSARDLTGALVVGLDACETERAVAVIDRLPEPNKRQVLVSLRPDTIAADPGLPQRLAGRIDLLHLPLAAARSWADIDDPAIILERLRALGHTVSLLSSGGLGGVAAYKDLRCAWPTQIRAVDPDAPDAGPIFCGIVAGFLANAGSLDWQNLKRALATAAAVTAAALPGPGPKRLLHLSRDDYHDLYHKLRRNAKF